jgi:sulfur carrier protein
MRIVLNGSPREVSDRANVEEIVATLGRDPSARGIAVAIDGEVVPRRDWSSTSVAEDARVEVLTAVQGG